MIRESLLCTMLWGCVAFGAEEAAAIREEPPAPPRNYGNLRIGATNAGSNGRPQICLEVTPLAFLSAEACGTGAGILHNEPGTEMSHYRGKLRFRSWMLSFGQLEARAHLGFAEIQVGEDQPGFFFTSAGPTRVETAGVETGASLRFFKTIGYGFDFIADVALDLAYLPHARQLIQPLSVVQPSVALSVGVGF